MSISLFLCFFSSNFENNRLRFSVKFPIISHIATRGPPERPLNGVLARAMYMIGGLNFICLFR